MELNKIPPKQHIEEMVASEDDIVVAGQIYKRFESTFKTKPDTMMKLKYKNAILFSVSYIGRMIAKGK